MYRFKFVSLCFVCVSLLSGFLVSEDYPGRYAEAKSEIEKRENVPTPGEHNKLAVAQVGVSRIDFSEIFDVWSGSWREIINQCRYRKMMAIEADAKMQDTWNEALSDAVREEVFYQQATNSLEKTIKAYAKNAFEASSGHTPRSDENPMYKQIEQRIRQEYRESISKAVDRHLDAQIKRIGGIDNLHEVLRVQGLTWEDWKNRIKRKAIVSAYLAQEIPSTKVSSPRPSEIREFYRSHADIFSLPGTLNFRHIFLSFKRQGSEDLAKKVASDIYAQIRDGLMTFADAAKLHSDDVLSAPYGGMEPLPQGALKNGSPAEREAWLADLREAAKGIHEGELAPLMVSDFGCHILKVTGMVPGRKVPFSSAQKRINQMIVSEKRQKLIDALYRDLRETVRVDILMPNYPPSYSWEKVKDMKLNELYSPDSGSEKERKIAGPELD